MWVQIRVYVIAFLLALVLGVVGFAVWRYNHTVDELKLEQAKNAHLLDSVAIQKQTIDNATNVIEQWKSAQDGLVKTVQVLQQQNMAAEKSLRELNDFYAKHDLTKLSIKKPSLMETHINHGTIESLRLLKCSSGSTDSDCSDSISKAQSNTAGSSANPHSNVPVSLENNHKR